MTLGLVTTAMGVILQRRLAAGDVRTYGVGGIHRANATGLVSITLAMNMIGNKDKHRIGKSNRRTAGHNNDATRKGQAPNKGDNLVGITRFTHRHEGQGERAELPQGETPRYHRAPPSVSVDRTGTRR